ncbi:MAG: diacylglycerol kinase family protein [Oscillospiraceae bacterium]|nr:diacylglycerol kinase family protein [Oscillospiraceae bacterium]
MKKSCFLYALSGLKTALVSERNLRIHISVMVMVFYFSRFYNFSRLEYALLVLTCAVVIALELVNTAIENAVDLSGEISDNAKTAKDTAAAAVLVAAIFAVLTGFFLFWDLDVFISITEKFDLLECVYLGVITALLMGFIVYCKRKEV